MGEKAEYNSYLNILLQRFIRHKLAIIGLIILLIEIVIVIFMPMLLGIDPYVSDYDAFYKAPDSTHILGTDMLGRDILIRLLYGGRVSLFVGISATMISVIIGLPLGLIGGYYRGLAETLIMRMADVFLSFPSIVIILVLVSVLGPNIWSVIMVIGVLGWPKFARIIHGKVLSLREKEYIIAAKSLGEVNYKIMLKHILPNAFSPLIVAITFQTATAIILEASLSFLGMGIQPPKPSWGNMLFEAQSISILTKAPWMWVPPGIAIVVTVLSINVVGDSIRDALDPKMDI